MQRAWHPEAAMRDNFRKVRIVGGWAAKAARLMVGVPDYETYVAHRRAKHPDQPIMT